MADPFTAAIERIHAQPRDQQQIRLTRFDHHTGRHPTVVQSPGVIADLGFGKHPPLTHTTRHTFERRYAIGQ